MNDFNHDWTDAEDKTLMNMKRASLNADEIAKHFDVSIKEIEDRIEALRVIEDV